MAKHGGVRAIDAGLSRMTEDDGRKGDILFPGFGRNGTDLLVVDICIANACAKSYVRNSRHRRIRYEPSYWKRGKLRSMNEHIGMLEWTSSLLRWNCMESLQRLSRNSSDVWQPKLATITISLTALQFHIGKRECLLPYNV